MPSSFEVPGNARDIPLLGGEGGAMSFIPGVSPISPSDGGTSSPSASSSKSGSYGDGASVAVVVAGSMALESRSTAVADDPFGLSVGLL